MNIRVALQIIMEESDISGAGSVIRVMSGQLVVMLL